ncbi:pseudouridine synthase [Cerasicoccus arenae]|uniref:Pseudouridine synthase RsuA/RluA-like domain-containing protein n=1 Tax=Cerasicoccus arenae TaxID=424488 RepID=A0A8J3D860_9BACT|nr:pseudouridine synthase [Cerasicoccus arenae]MBK1859311.1 hypothetical protein [Cerasicoccus arenae]GHB94239.1 hypothetical protein GCM10007047_07390 [Cerasicoccus arenae]
MPDAITIDFKTELKIGFPPPLLGDEPVRLSAAVAGDGLLALALPGGFPSEAHPFFPKAHTVIAGLQAQLRAKKPELERLGMEVALSVNFLEPESSGLLLVAYTRAGVERWRNAFGSSQIEFTYELIVKANAELADELVCDLPVARHKARHKSESRMLVSHKTGKKSHTVFRRGAVCGGYERWTATTALPRLHQIRLHAMEVGLCIPGETLYGEIPPLTWSVLKGPEARGDRGGIVERPLVHLARIRMVEGLTGLEPLECPPEGPLARIWAEFTD